MSGTLRSLPLLAAFVFSAPPTAHAVPCSGPGVPCDVTSIIPPCVMLLPGLADGFTDPLTAPYQPLTIVINDVFFAAVPGVMVTLSFAPAGDVRISTTQEAGAIVSCPALTVSKLADGVGTVTFRVCGAGRNSIPFGGVGPGGFDLVGVAAGGEFLGRITATVPDENGAGTAGTVTNGIDPGDGTFFRYDLFLYSGTAGRSDFNCNGAVDPADGAALRDFQFNDPASAAPQTTLYCP